MVQHDTQTKEQNPRRQHQQQYLTPDADVLPASTSNSTSTSATSLSYPSNSSSSSSATSILDPPPPYLPSRAHSSNDLNAYISNACIVNTTSRPDPLSIPRQDLNTLISSGTPVILSIPSSGSATPKAVPGSISSSSLANPHVGTSASTRTTGASLRKTLSSVDDVIWADVRRRQRKNRRGYDDDDDDANALRYVHGDTTDEGNASSDVNENLRDSDAHMYTYASSDHDRHLNSTKLRPITTGSKYSAGETETEMDEPSRQHPTLHKISPLSLLDLISGPSPTSPLSPMPQDPLSTPPLLAKLSQSRFTPILFELCRLLSIVPAGLGFIWHLWCFVCALQAVSGRTGTGTTSANASASPSLLREIGRDVVEFVDFKMTIHTPFDHFVCILWTLLTAHQCLSLTTGLQLRWRAYYHSHATLIRLLALQAICWPATQYTLILFNHHVRPVVCWALIGSTTCFSRAVQIWVVSNLKVVRHRISGKTRSFLGADVTAGPGRGGFDSSYSSSGTNSNQAFRHQYHSDVGDDSDAPGGDAIAIQWVARRWDWPLVVHTCVIPAAVVYFVMAWVGELRREVAGCQ